MKLKKIIFTAIIDVNENRLKFFFSILCDNSYAILFFANENLYCLMFCWKLKKMRICTVFSNSGKNLCIVFKPLPAALLNVLLDVFEENAGSQDF